MTVRTRRRHRHAIDPCMAITVPTPWPPRLFFSEAGLLALRAMMADRRWANPVTFAHVRRDLGIDPGPEQA